MQTVDLMGSGDWEEPSESVARAGTAGDDMNGDGGEEKNMTKKYTSSKRIPKLLSKLQDVMDASELKRISQLDENTRPDDEFANRKVWVCKDCVVKFNMTAKGVFDFKARDEGETRGKKISAKLKMLRDLQLNASPFLAHSYPVGEIPALCTPRMYEALHDHTFRQPNVSVAQASQEYSRDIIGTIGATKAQAALPAVPRRTPAPPLPMLRISTATQRQPNSAVQDDETAQLLDRLGLTPRVMVRLPFEYAMAYSSKKGRQPDVLSVSPSGSRTERSATSGRRKRL